MRGKHNCVSKDHVPPLLTAYEKFPSRLMCMFFVACGAIFAVKRPPNNSRNGRMLYVELVKSFFRRETGGDALFLTEHSSRAAREVDTVERPTRA